MIIIGSLALFGSRLASRSSAWMRRERRPIVDVQARLIREQVDMTVILIGDEP
jgi:hypothetical protein